MDAMTDDSQFTHAVFAAYDKMPALERSAIDGLALDLSETVKKSHPKAMLGKDSAVELLGKLGAFLVQSEVVKCTCAGNVSLLGNRCPVHPEPVLDTLVKYNIENSTWNALR